MEKTQKEHIKDCTEFKMEKEFNLSDEEIIDGILGKVYAKKNIKEFIKRLKETLFNEALARELPITDTSLDKLPLTTINQKIDKLAGDGLI